MKITKCKNGLFKIVLKGISQPFYTESEGVALEIAMKLGGATK